MNFILKSYSHQNKHVTNYQSTNNQSQCLWRPPLRRLALNLSLLTGGCASTTPAPPLPARPRNTHSLPDVLRRGLYVRPTWGAEWVISNLLSFPFYFLVIHVRVATYEWTVFLHLVALLCSLVVWEAGFKFSLDLVRSVWTPQVLQMLRVYSLFSHYLPNDCELREP